MSLCREVTKSWGPGIFPGYHECEPWLLLEQTKRKQNQKNFLACTIPLPLIACTRQLEILVTALSMMGVLGLINLIMAVYSLLFLRSKIIRYCQTMLCLYFIPKFLPHDSHNSRVVLYPQQQTCLISVQNILCNYLLSDTLGAGLHEKCYN